MAGGAEGFNGKNGWGISPHGPETKADVRDREEANDLLDILEHEIIPTFYNRGKHGYSKEWVRLSKESMKSCIPRFNASRMVMDYVKNLYKPATIQYKKFKENNSAAAKELARWKAKVNRQWHNISIERIDESTTAINDGESMTIKVKVHLNGLLPEDVAVECIVGSIQPQDDNDATLDNATCYVFDYASEENGFHIFVLKLHPNNSGMNYYKMRIFPYHTLLSHPLETGFMIWL